MYAVQTAGFDQNAKTAARMSRRNAGARKGKKTMKKNAYDAGREDGLYLALKIVREGGLEALEKEIRFRNITGIKTSLAMKEIEGATQEIKNNVIDTITCLAVHTLHDEFGFGKERAARYVNRFNEKVECLMNQLVYWEDMIEENKKMGIETKIRMLE